MPMLQIAIKVLISASVIVAITELAKRSNLLGAALAALPITSLLAFIWLYLDTGDAERVANLSTNIFWLVIPSLMLFLALPMLLRAGYGFWPSLLGGAIATMAAYAVMWRLLSAFGIQLNA
jgi:hypothetical protein